MWLLFSISNHIASSGIGNLIQTWRTKSAWYSFCSICPPIVLLILIGTVSLISGNIPSSICWGGWEVNSLRLSGLQVDSSSYEIFHALQHVIRPLLVEHDQNLGVAIPGGRPSLGSV